MMLGHSIGLGPDKLLYQKNDRLVSNEHSVGVEVELEGIRYSKADAKYPPLFDLWSYHEDGSLRNGSEFVFKGGLRGANIIAALDLFRDFVEKWESRNPAILISDRCSVHVHLDIRDLDLLQIRNLVMWYIFVERAMFSLVDKSRAKNNYCRPVTDSDFIDSFQQIYSYVHHYKGSLTKHSRSLYDRFFEFSQSICEKYSAFNMKTSRTIGTVEFRHHHGTKDSEEILRWINSILRLKVWAIENPIESFYERGRLDKSLLTTIFPENKDHWELLDNSGILDYFVAEGRCDVESIIKRDILKTSIDYYSSSFLAEKKLKGTSTPFFKFKKIHGLGPKYIY